MKKWMIIEIIVLAALLLAAVIACMGLTQQVYAPDVSTDTSAWESKPEDNVQEQTQEQTTEPEPSWMTLPADYTLTAQQYFVYDCQSGEFLTLSGDQAQRVYPASITKLFTAYVALQYLDSDAQITAGEELELVAWGSSVAELQQGDTLTVERLVEAMLLPSGNDAAYVLATAAGRVIGGEASESASASIARFMEEMNAQAARLGMTGTHFVNPDGIHDSEHYMTFADLALLGKLAMENSTIMKYANVSREEVELTQGSVQWKNTNELIDPTSEYYCPYAVGLKTGQTPSAGSCLLSAFEMGGRKLIIGVFGCPDVDDRFADTLLLFNQEIGIQ